MAAVDFTLQGKNRKWSLPFLGIIVVCAAAHLGCLGSQFYMDDMPQIRDSEWVRSGNLGVLDYYKMQNMKADTDMRDAIAGKDTGKNSSPLV